MPPAIDSFIVLGIVLVIARFIKRGSKVLQRLFIPSALVAGIGGLVLGPQVLGTITSDVTYYWAMLPKHLITVVFAGLFLGKTIPRRKEIWRHSGPMIAFGSTMAWGQYALGAIITLLVLIPFFNANPLSAALIEISFAGGHGTAAGLAPTFEALGWAEGADIALGLATLSIITAVLTGILMINIYNRKRRLLDPDQWQKQEKHLIRSGYNLLAFTQKFNTNPKAVAINAVGFGASIGIGWLILKALIYAEELVLSGFTEVRFFTYLPLFPLAMLGGLLLQLFLRKIGKQHLIQRRTAQIISSIALDLLIASAIATVSLRVIGNNLGIFFVLGIVGIAWIVGCFFLLAPKFFYDHWFERGITDYGQAMGMTATGLLMNRLADPSNTLKIRESFAYKQLIFEPFLGGGVVTAMAAIFISEAGLLPALIVSSIATIGWLIVGLRLGKKKPPVPHFPHLLDQFKDF